MRLYFISYSRMNRYVLCNYKGPLRDFGILCDFFLGASANAAYHQPPRGRERRKEAFVWSPRESWRPTRIA